MALKIYSYLTLADLSISCGVQHNDSFSLFLTDSPADPIMTITADDNPPSCHGICFADSPCDHVLFGENGSGQILCADRNWENAVLYTSGRKDPENALVLAALCSRLSFFDTLLFHASLVDYRGHGVLFTGYSGVGKTTQAKLWAKYMGADIVNGDKVLVRHTPDGWFAYGLPWKGSSSYCLNRRLPLAGITVLGQAKANSIRPLAEPEIMRDCFPHIFLPAWDEACVDAAAGTFSSLISSVPVLKLSCLPDEQAVRMTADCLHLL